MSVWNSPIYLGDLALSEPSVVAPCYLTRRQSLCMCMCSLYHRVQPSLWSHISQRLLSHTLTFQTACLSTSLAKNRYVERQALSPRFPTHSLSELLGENERSPFCVSSDENQSACGERRDMSPFRQIGLRRRRWEEAWVSPLTSAGWCVGVKVTDEGFCFSASENRTVVHF